MNAHYTLCQLAQIPDPGAKGFYLEELDLDLFVVRRGGTVRAYRNSCPHTGAPMEWMPDQFLNLDGNLIQCGIHAALFEIHDGRCIAGPCVGQFLHSLALEIRDGAVILTQPGAGVRD